MEFFTKMKKKIIFFSKKRKKKKKKEKEKHKIKKTSNQSNNHSNLKKMMKHSTSSLKRKGESTKGSSSKSASSKKHKIPQQQHESNNHEDDEENEEEQEHQQQHDDQIQSNDNKADVEGNQDEQENNENQQDQKMDVASDDKKEDVEEKKTTVTVAAAAVVEEKKTVDVVTEEKKPAKPLVPVHIHADISKSPEYFMNSLSKENLSKAKLVKKSDTQFGVSFELQSHRGIPIEIKTPPMKVLGTPFLHGVGSKFQEENKEPLDDSKRKFKISAIPIYEGHPLNNETDIEQLKLDPSLSGLGKEFKRKMEVDLLDTIVDIYVKDNKLKPDDPDEHDDDDDNNGDDDDDNINNSKKKKKAAQTPEQLLKQQEENMKKFKKSKKDTMNTWVNKGNPAKNMISDKEAGKEGKINVSRNVFFEKNRSKTNSNNNNNASDEKGNNSKNAKSNNNNNGGKGNKNVKQLKEDDDNDDEEDSNTNNNNNKKKVDPKKKTTNAVATTTNANDNKSLTVAVVNNNDNKSVKKEDPNATVVVDEYANIDQTLLNSILKKSQMKEDLSPNEVASLLIKMDKRGFIYNAMRYINARGEPFLLKNKEGKIEQREFVRNNTAIVTPASYVSLTYIVTLTILTSGQMWVGLKMRKGVQILKINPNPSQLEYDIGNTCYDAEEAVLEGDY